jgi:hypothetical protein
MSVSAIDIKLEGKASVPLAAMLLLMFYRKNPQHKLHISYKINCNTLRQDCKLNGASVASISQIRPSTILLLLSTVRLWKTRDGGGFQRHNIHPKFHEFRKSGSKVKIMDTQTHMDSMVIS